MQREEAIEKVRKLLALADGNANENEAIAAALKAQKIMADFDLQEADFAEEVDREPVEVKSAAYHKGLWRDWLAGVVSENFRCKAYVQNAVRGGRQHVFVGYELDAKAATMTYEHLAEVGAKLAGRECARHRKLYGSARGIKNSFLSGFVDGVRSELEKQTQALMLVCPQEVEEYFDGLDLGVQRPRRLAIDRSASASGLSAGRDAVRSGRIGAGGERLLASA